MLRSRCARCAAPDARAVRGRSSARRASPPGRPAAPATLSPTPATAPLLQDQDPPVSVAVWVEQYLGYKESFMGWLVLVR